MRRKILCLIVLLTAYLLGCSSTRQVAKDIKPHDKASLSEDGGKIIEDFDPLNLQEDELDIQSIKLLGTSRLFDRTLCHRAYRGEHEP